MRSRYFIVVPPNGPRRTLFSLKAVQMVLCSFIVVFKSFGCVRKGPLCLPYLRSKYVHNAPSDVFSPLQAVISALDEQIEEPHEFVSFTNKGV